MHQLCKWEATADFHPVNLENRTRRDKETDESYIILMKAKSHLQFEISSTMTCINKRFRKASWIRKIKEKTSSRTVIEYIRNINRLTNTNWAKFRKRQFRESIHWKKWRLIWDNLTRNKEIQD